MSIARNLPLRVQALVAVCAAASFALYVAIAAAGRAWPAQLSAQWVGAAGAALLLLAVWAGLVWSALALAGMPRSARPAAVVLGSSPLCLLALPVAAVYVSDEANHLLTRFGEYEVAPLLVAGLAALAVQAWLVARLRWLPGPMRAEASPATGRHAVRGELPIAVPLFLALFALYVFTSGGHLHIVDEQFNYAVAKHIVDWASIEANIQGEQYSKYGVVTPVLLAPLYAWDKLLGHPLPPGDRQIHWSWLHGDEGGPYPPLPLLVYSPAWTALAAALLYLLARVAGASRGIALCTALIYALATVAWVYSKTLYNNATANALLLGSVLALAAQEGGARGERSRGGLQARVWPGVVAGALLGLAVATRYDLVAFAPVLGWFAWRSGRGGPQGSQRTQGRGGVLGSVTSRAAHLASFAAACAAVVLPLVVWLNHAKYGSPFDFGYRGGEQALDIYLESPIANMYGLLFSFGFGLFPSSPLLLVALAGYPALRRARPALAAVCLALFLVAVPLYGTYTGWAGGRNYGPRYMLTVASFLLVLASALLPTLWRSWGGKLLCVACVAWGFVYAAAGALISYGLGFMSIFLEQAAYAREQGIALTDQTLWWDARFSPVAAQLRLIAAWLQRGDYFFAPLAAPAANFPGPGGLDFYLFQHFRGPVLRPLLLVSFGAFVVWQAYLLTRALRAGRSQRPPAAEAGEAHARGQWL